MEENVYCLSHFRRDRTGLTIEERKKKRKESLVRILVPTSLCSPNNLYRITMGLSKPIFIDIAPHPADTTPLLSCENKCRIKQGTSQKLPFAKEQSEE